MQFSSRFVPEYVKAHTKEVVQIKIISPKYALKKMCIIAIISTQTQEPSFKELVGLNCRENRNWDIYNCRTMAL